MKYLKTYKIFESYPPNKFEIESERLFSKLLPDVKDILLELIDTGIKVDINKYIDDCPWRATALASWKIYFKSSICF